MSKYYLTESQLSNVISDTLYNLLTEDKESKNMAKARGFLKKTGKSNDEAMNIVNSIRHDIPNVRLNQNKYALGATRLYNSGELNDATKIFNLNQLIGLIAKVYDNQYDNNLNGESLTDLWVKYKPELEQQTQSSKENLMKQTYNWKSEYKVVRIESFEEAQKYGGYVDWCITQTKSAFDNYTNEGLNLFYFLLKNGFENTPDVVGDDAPKDEYGLSMISVSVGEDGRMLTSTSRWNHENGGSDNTFSVEEISNLLGRNFYDVCKPYSNEEIQRKKDAINKPFLDAQRRLEAGEEPTDIFDFVGDFNDGFGWVKLNGKCNYIDRDGKILSPNQWFDGVDKFSGWFSRVLLNGKYNFINSEGKLLSPNQWFDEARNFKDGFGQVLLNGKWNYINSEGKILSPNQWFDLISDFEDGFGRVILNDKLNFTNSEGKILSPNQWFDWAYEFHDGFSRVRLNGQYYKIDKNGNLSNI